MNILLITEQRDAQWNKTSFETLAAAQQIAAETNSRLTAVVMGKGVAGLADELAVNKLDEVLLVEHDMALVRQICDYVHVLDFGIKIFEASRSLPPPGK